MQGTKGPEKHANYSPVRKLGVSGLMIISRRRRLLARSRSLRSTAIPKSSAVNTGDREKSEKSMSGCRACGEKQGTYGVVS